MDRIREIVRTRKKAHKKRIDLKSKTYRVFLEMEKAAYADGALQRKQKELISLDSRLRGNDIKLNTWGFSTAW